MVLEDAEQVGLGSGKSFGHARSRSVLPCVYQPRVVRKVPWRTHSRRSTREPIARQSYPRQGGRAMAPLEPPSAARHESAQLEPDERGRPRPGRTSRPGGRRRPASSRPARAFQTRSSLASRSGGGGRRSGPIDPEVVQEIVGAADHRRAVADHLERRLGERARDGARHREDLPSELERVVDGDPRSAPRLSLHDDERSRERDHDPVPRGEVLRTGRDAGRVLAHERAGPDDRAEEVPAARRVGDVDPGAEHGDRATPGLQRALDAPPRRSRAPRRRRPRDPPLRARVRGPPRPTARGPSTSSIRRSRRGRGRRRSGFPRRKRHAGGS